MRIVIATLALMLTLTLLGVITVAQVTGDTPAEDEPPVTNVVTIETKLTTDCQTLDPGSADLAIYNGLCSVSLGVRADAELVRWYSGGQLLAEGTAYVFTPVFDALDSVKRVSVQAVVYYSLDPDNIQISKSLPFTINVHPVPVLSPGQAATPFCQWVDQNVGGACTRAVDYAVTAAIGAIIAAFGFWFAF